jgi:hypothetical protein
VETVDRFGFADNVKEEYEKQVKATKKVGLLCSKQD